MLCILLHDVLGSLPAELVADADDDVHDDGGVIVVAASHLHEGEVDELAGRHRRHTADELEQTELSNTITHLSINIINITTKLYNNNYNNNNNK